MTATYRVTSVSDPVKGSVSPPGSSGLTHRALVVAALANGRSRVCNALESDDTRVMIGSLGRLGVTLQHDPQQKTVDVEGCHGRFPEASAELWLENSGTSIRFLTALCALGHGTFHLDGNSRMRERPIGDLIRSLNSLGVDARCDLGTDCPPVTVHAQGLAGGEVTVSGFVSSQFLSSLLMAAPCARGPMKIQVEGHLVSRPYVEMTLGVMAQFGVAVECPDEGVYAVHPQQYAPAEYTIEPDASAASYFFAAAAITGGEVTIPGFSYHSLQGDIAFVELLERMGCRVNWQADYTTLRGGTLHGIDVDMNAIGETVQTLAAIAPFADGPTRIRNVAHIRHKETDRLKALVTELTRLGIRIEEHSDGLSIYPGGVQPAVIETYNDHRMAMSFTLIGLKVPGIEIENPQCVAKTYPNFFRDLESLCATNV